MLSISSLQVLASAVYRLSTAGNLIYTRQFIEGAPRLFARERCLGISPNVAVTR